MSFMKWVLPILLLLAASVAFGQPVEEWVARYNGPPFGRDQANAVTVDADGNVYVTGYSYGNGGNADVATIKYDPDGEVVWLDRYNGPADGSDYGQDIAVDASGNVYVTGTSEGSGTRQDYVTIKYQSDGRILWAERYDGPGQWDYAEALAVDASGNVYVIGTSDGGYPGTQDDYATIKYGPDGNELWVRRYSGPGSYDDGANDLAVDASGNVYVTGFTIDANVDANYTTIKYDPDGDTLWVREYYGTGGSDQAQALALDASGNVYVTGYSSGIGTSQDIATVKYDTDGNGQWAARYNGPDNDRDVGREVAVDASGNVFAFGYTVRLDTDEEDFVTIKYDPDGMELWARLYNGPGNDEDYPKALALDAYGNAYVCGNSYDSTTLLDYATLKYASNGDLVWTVRYDGPANDTDYGSDLALDASDNVYVTGGSTGIGTDLDYATIKYSQPTAVETGTSANTLPETFGLTCQPNPFNATTTIMYSLPEGGKVSLGVYNLRGQLIAALIDDYQGAGEYDVIWDASDYSSGVYFYKLQAGDFVSTKKMNLLK